MEALKSVLLSDVKPESLSWLWPDWIGKGVLTFMVGEPGIGKSSMSWDLLARHTGGGEWPDGQPVVTGRGLIISGEDHLANWIVPQLKKFGADMGRLRSLTPDGNHGLRLDRDCSQLEKLVKEDGIDFVVIDPFATFLGDVNPNQSADVRTITNQLAGMAQRNGAAVVVLHHFNKNEGASSGNRVAGSVDIVGAARTVMYVVQDPNDPESRAVFIQKSNLGQSPHPMLYSQDARGCLEWLEAPESFDWRKAMKAKSDGVVEEAVEFLAVIMEEHDGEVRSSIVLDQMKDAGISKGALDKAKAVLGVRSKRVGGSNGYWVFRWKETQTKAA